MVVFDFDVAIRAFELSVQPLLQALMMEDVAAYRDYSDLFTFFEVREANGTSLVFKVVAFLVLLE